MTIKCISGFIAKSHSLSVVQELSSVSGVILDKLVSGD